MLPAFLETVAAAGVRRFAIHARKAWLEGLSPKQNREIPPLDHALVLRMKARLPGARASSSTAASPASTQARGLPRARPRRRDDRPRRLPRAGAARRGRPARSSARPAPTSRAEAAVAAMLPYIEAERGARHRRCNADHPAHARRLPGPPRRPRLAAACCRRARTARAPGPSWCARALAEVAPEPAARIPLIRRGGGLGQGAPPARSPRHAPARPRAAPAAGGAPRRSSAPSPG